jgi:Fic family protein
MDKKLLEKIIEKKKLLAKHKPISPILKKNLNDWMRVKLTYNSNAIEGNTLNEQETALVVNEWITIAGKYLREIIEAKNHDEALTYVITLSKKLKINNISQIHILEIHRIILSLIDKSNSWVYRRVPVRILGSQTILPNYLKVPDLMDELDHRLKKTKDNPIKIACDLHYKLVSIHPFVDGNGRTARLAFNLVLLIAGYPLVCILHAQRNSYLASLEKAQTGWSMDTYYDFMMQSIERSLDIYLEAVQNKQGKPESKQKISLLKISQLAKAADMAVSAIRYRTELGLLKIEQHTPWGYALYHPSMLQTINLIKRMQTEQRLSLNEIHKMLW